MKFFPISSYNGKKIRKFLGGEAVAEFNLKECWPRIVGFYPCYRPDGSNSTCIVFLDGSQHIDRRKTRTFLQSAAKVFSTDLTALRRNYQRFLGSKGMVPLPLHSNFILVPFKVRKPQYKDHGATGYVVFSQIWLVEDYERQDAGCQKANGEASGRQKANGEGSGRDDSDVEDAQRQESDGNFLSRLTMTGGITLASLEKVSTLNRRLGDAARVRQEYRRFYGSNTLLTPRMLGGATVARDSGVSGTQGLSGVLGEATPGVGGVIYHIHFHTEGTPDSGG